jgi:hypothetical protein
MSTRLIAHVCKRAEVRQHLLRDTSRVVALIDVAAITLQQDRTAPQLPDLFRILSVVLSEPKQTQAAHSTTMDNLIRYIRSQLTLSFLVFLFSRFPFFSFSFIPSWITPSALLPPVLTYFTISSPSPSSSRSRSPSPSPLQSPC